MSAIKDRSAVQSPLPPDFGVEDERSERMTPIQEVTEEVAGAELIRSSSPSAPQEKALSEGRRSVEVIHLPESDFKENSRVSSSNNLAGLTQPTTEQGILIRKI